MDIETILATLRSRVDADELAALESDIRAAHSRGDRHWLEDLLEAAESLPLPEVPPVVSRDLRNLLRGPTAPESHVAELVRDTRADRSLVGVRGTDVTEGWSLTYASEVADLIVDVWPMSSGAVAVEGQLMPHGGLGGAVRASMSGPATSVVGGDELGRFRFEGLAPGRYRISVDDGRIEVSATVDLEPA